MKKKYKFLKVLSKQKPLKDRVKEWFIVTMGLIGFGLTIKEIVDLSKKDVNISFLCVIITLTLCGVISYFYLLFKNREMFSKSFKWTNGYEVTVVVGDYFETLEAYPDGVAVSGMSSTINTDKAKKDSVYYGIYKEYCKVNKKNVGAASALEFDKEVINGKCKSVEANLNEESKEKNCELGEISKVHFINEEDKIRYAFFISNSQIENNRDEFYGNMQSLNSFDKLWEAFIETNIFPSPLVMPMLGTGHSKDNSEMSSAVGIIESFFEYCYIKTEGKKGNRTVVNSIVLSIPITFITEQKINLYDLHRYIELKDNLLDILYVNNGKYEKIIG
ncbi:hypothetical protein P7H60_09655 [Vagococcus carniphilus]|uniref:hypothetical protein n=1 Tax=Vagococcus carniphilus TaxID=218144 RepID=UPI00288D1975|nr:hypothetical protein [Vagococcus carniphilus]MDT2849422.1 hypothetical protein [Vagococcus carniphilus]